MTTDSPEFLPCPFCGMHLVARYLKHPEVVAHPEHPDCIARHAIIHPENRAAWNRRPDRSPAGEVQHALDELLDLTACRCGPEYSDRRLHHPECNHAARVSVEKIQIALSPAPAPSTQAEAMERDHRAIHRLMELVLDEVKLIRNNGVTANNIGYLASQAKEWSGRHCAEPVPAPSDGMEPLEADFAAVWDANLDELYESGPAPAPEREGMLLEALQSLVSLNDDGGPFGGEMYQDRIDRAWDAARAALAAYGESKR